MILTRFLLIINNMDFCWFKSILLKRICFIILLSTLSYLHSLRYNQYNGSLWSCFVRGSVLGYGLTSYCVTESFGSKLAPYRDTSTIFSPRTWLDKNHRRYTAVIVIVIVFLPCKHDGVLEFWICGEGKLWDDVTNFIFLWSDRHFMWRRFVPQNSGYSFDS